jgi:hypothetical protein
MHYPGRDYSCASFKLNKFFESRYCGKGVSKFPFPKYRNTLRVAELDATRISDTCRMQTIWFPGQCTPRLRDHV